MNRPLTKADATNIYTFINCLKLKDLFIYSKICGVDFKIYYPKLYPRLSKLWILRPS